MPKFQDRLRLFARAAAGLFSDRAVQGAYGLLSGIYASGTGEPPKRGTKEFLQAYSTMPWLRAATHRVASSIAQNKWSLYTIRQNGRVRRGLVKELRRCSFQERQVELKALSRAKELEEITEHPFLGALYSPNPFLSGFAVRKLNQIYLDIVGEGFLLKDRNSLGVTEGFWPLPPHWIKETPTPKHRRYRIQVQGWSQDIPDSEILWMADADPVNPYSRGSGTAESLADELETDEYAAKHIKSWFYNRAKPDVLFYHKDLGKSEVDRLGEWYNAKHRGLYKAFQAEFLNRDLKIHEFKQDFQSMQLTELRQMERDVVIQVYGVPPEILGIISSSNRATITEAKAIYGEFVLLPRLEFQREIYQERILPDYDDGLLLEYESPIPADKTHRLAAAKAAPWARTTDEWREMQGLDPLPHGEGASRMVPQNLVELSSVSARKEKAL